MRERQTRPHWLPAMIRAEEGAGAGRVENLCGDAPRRPCRSEELMAAETSVVDEAPVDGANSRRLRYVIVVAAAVMALAGWWLTHPSAFWPAGNESITTSVVGDPLVLPAWIHPDSGVHLRSVAPVVVANTGGAELSMFVCPSGVAVGNVELADDCRPFSAGTPFEGSAQELVVHVDGTSPGVIKIEGFEVEYRQGLQFGSDVTGLHLTACFRPDASSPVPEECVPAGDE